MSEKGLTSRQMYDFGEKYSITSTIANDFVPLYAIGGAKIYGVLTKRAISGVFLDFSSAYSCAPLGFNNSAIKKAMMGVIDTGLWQFPSHDWHSRQPVLLKKKLAELAPTGKTNRVFLVNSGTEAIEAAMKFCEARRGSTKVRPLFMAFDKAFHGRTHGSLSLNASKEIHRKGFHCSHVVNHIPFPEAGDNQSIHEFNNYLNKFVKPSQVNAMVIELVQGEGGIRLIDWISLRRLLSFCKENGIYVIVDEVQTGLMRTGTMFACEQFNFYPDMICLAKALGCAAPLGAVIATEEFNLKPGQHSSTFGGSPLACAGALALIEELEKLNWQEFEEKVLLLKKIASEGVGLMRRIVFDTPEERDKVVDKAYLNGLILIGAGESAIRLMPPVNISIDELQEGLEILRGIL